MANVKIQTTIPLTIVDNGQRFSPRKGEILEVPEETAEALIEDSLASEYKLIEPTGKITITENGSDIDVAQYAKADVAIPNPNNVVTVTGTMANPWGNLDVAELIAAIKADNATAYINFTFNGTTFSKVYVRVVQGDHFFVSLFGSAGTLQTCAGFSAEYTSEGAIETCYSLAGGVVLNLTSQASELTIELVVIYHPLPEA